LLSYYSVIVQNVISAKIENVDKRRPMAQNPFLRIFQWSTTILVIEQSFSL